MSELGHYGNVVDQHNVNSRMIKPETSKSLDRSHLAKRLSHNFTGLGNNKVGAVSRQDRQVN
jgi:hypothetical protein